MQFPNQLYEARLVRRYNRFLADVVLLDGTPLTVHCPNTGAMAGIKNPGIRVWIAKVEGETSRKYPWTWYIAESDDALVGVNACLPNTLVAEALENGKLSGFEGYTCIRREVRYGQNSRIDFLLGGENIQPCWLEVKNVHMKRGSRAEFPDSVTTRGAKHLLELEAKARQGERCVVLYVVQRGDCDGFAIAADIDPAYNQAFRSAALQGVEQLCHKCDVTLSGITLGESLPVHLS